MRLTERPLRNSAGVAVAVAVVIVFLHWKGYRRWWGKAPNPPSLGGTGGGPQ